MFVIANVTFDMLNATPDNMTMASTSSPDPQDPSSTEMFEIMRGPYVALGVLTAGLIVLTIITLLCYRYPLRVIRRDL